MTFVTAVGFLAFVNYHVMYLHPNDMHE